MPTASHERCDHGTCACRGGRQDRLGPHGKHHRRRGPGALRDEPGSREVLLLGNLQVGKTTLFHRLCGERAWYGPTPESSEDLRCGRLVPVISGGHRLWHRLWRLPDDHLGPPTLVVDTPGVSDLLHPQSQEEESVQRALLRRGSDLVVVVADPANLRRGLALLLQAAAFGKPMVLALQRDQGGGVVVDTGRLESLLELPVVDLSAREDRGIAALTAALDRARPLGRKVPLSRKIQATVDELERGLAPLGLPSRAAALLLLSGDAQVQAQAAAALPPEVLAGVTASMEALRHDLRLPLSALLTEIHHREAERIAVAVSQRPAEARALSRRLGDLAQHPVWGVPIAALVIALAYLWVGELGATRVVDFLNVHLFEGVLMPLSARLLAPVPWPLLRDALLDPDFGLLPTGLFLAFGLVMPVLAFFYFAFALLQRSGYLARLTVLLDRLLRRIGLNGKGVLPLAMGLSCVTMALITTRMLERRRERLIASFLLLLGVPCAPLLAVMLVIFKELPLSAALLVFGVLFVQIVVAGMLANRLMRGRVSDFILEMPPLRWPDPVGVISETVHGTWAFMREAVPLFLAASLALFVADKLGALDLLERAAHPLTHGLLGLPDQAVQVFIKTLIRRENGATELMLVRGGFTRVQQVITLLVMVGLTPCINAVLVLVKEQGPGRAAVLVGAVTTWTILLSTTIAHLCRWLGVTF